MQQFKTLGDIETYYWGYETTRKSPDACGWRVDYTITRCCLGSIEDILGGGLYQHDRLTNFFAEAKDRCAFDYWFFGHYHDNRVLMRKYVLLYAQIVEIALWDEERN